MATAGSDYQITINAVGYTLDNEAASEGQPIGPPRWREGRADSTVPIPGTGEIDTGSAPNDEYIVAYVPSFGGGFGQAYYDPANPNRYAVATGAYLANDYQAGPANRLRHLGFGIVDPTAEETGLGATSPWTLSSATMAATASNAHTGRYHWLFTATAGSGRTYQTIANPTVLQSSAVVFRAMGGTATGTVRLFIWDDVTGYTYSSAAAAGAYAAMSVTATINAAAATIRVGVEGTNNTDNARIDDLELQFGTPSPVGFAELSSNWYTASGRAVYQFDATNAKFDFVRLQTPTAMDIAQFNGNVFVANGNAAAFVYGSGTTWTASNRVGNLAYADFFVASMDRVGNPVIWRGLKPNTVSVSTSGLNGGTAWTNYTVGDSDTNLTGVYVYGDTIVVGKEDGVYLFQTDHFINVTTEYAVARSTQNFAHAHEFGGSLYLGASQGTMWRLTYGTLEGPLMGYSIEGYTYGPTGRVGAIGIDAAHLFVGRDPGPTGSTPWLLYTRDGDTVHTLVDFCSPTQTGYLTGDTDVVWADPTLDTYGNEFNTIDAIGTFNGYTYVAGTGTTGYTHNSLVRFVSPTLSEIPFRDTAFDSNLGYYIRLPKMHGGFPSEVKSWKTVKFYIRPSVSGNLRIYYKVDGAAWASLGAAAGSDSDPFTSLAFTNVNGRELELLVWGDMGATPDNTRPLEFLPITVTATLRPARKRVFVAWVNIGSQVANLTGAPDTSADSVVLYDNIRTAETTNNPVTLTYQEELTVGPDTRSISVHVTRMTLDRLVENPSTGGWGRVYRVDMVEA